MAKKGASKKKKGKCEIIRLVSTGKHPTKKNKKTGTFTTKKVNLHNQKMKAQDGVKSKTTGKTGKLELMRYDKVTGKHELFVQQKDSK